jgi:hypothetical protein
MAIIKGFNSMLAILCLDEKTSPRKTEVKSFKEDLEGDKKKKHDEKKKKAEIEKVFSNFVENNKGFGSDVDTKEAIYDKIR